MNATPPLPPELETLTAAQVAASFGRTLDWWIRVHARMVAEFGFPAPLRAPFCVRPDKGSRNPGKRIPLIYNKVAVIEWHRRQAGLDAPKPELSFNLAALDRAS